MIEWESGEKRSGGWRTEPIKHGIRKQLLYSGSSQNVIYLTYREYATSEEEAYARAPFYQDLTYDISNSNEIAFQDIKITVESADQKGIRFKVTEGPSFWEL